MGFIYHIFIFFTLIMPFVWGNILLESLIDTSLFLYGALTIFSICFLRKKEAIFCTICLGLLIDTVNFETKLWGISSLLLSAPVVLFQDNSWRNVFKYRTFTWGIFLNLLLQLMFVSIHFLYYHISFSYIKGYFLSFIISAIVASLLLKILFRVEHSYWL